MRRAVITDGYGGDRFESGVVAVLFAGHVGRVNPRVREAHCGELTRPELCYLDIECRTDARHGVLGDASRDHSFVDSSNLPCGYPERARLRDGAGRDAGRPAPARDQSVREVGELRNPERIRADPDLDSSLTKPVPCGLCRLAGGASLCRHYLLLTLASSSARTRIMSPSPHLPTSPIVANTSCPVQCPSWSLFSQIILLTERDSRPGTVPISGPLTPQFAM